MKKIVFTVTIILLVFFFQSTIPKLSLAAGTCDSTSDCPSGEVCTESRCQSSADIANICGFESIFANVVSVFGVLIGFAFFVMMVLGGIRYLLSGGDPKAVQAAKGTITWGIIGLAFFAISFTILLIIKAFTGVDVTVFKVCGY